MERAKRIPFRSSSSSLWLSLLQHFWEPAEASKVLFYLLDKLLQLTCPLWHLIAPSVQVSKRLLSKLMYPPETCVNGIIWELRCQEWSFFLWILYVGAGLCVCLGMWECVCGRGISWVIFGFESVRFAVVAEKFLNIVGCGILKYWIAFPSPIHISYPVCVSWYWLTSYHHFPPSFKISNKLEIG